LVADLEAARYFEEVIRLAPQLSATLVANWVIGEVPALLHHYGKTWKELPVSSSALAELLNAVASSQINLKTAKKVLIQIWETGRSAAEILKAESLGQVESEDLLKTWVDQVMAAQPAAVEQYKAGRTQAMGFLVGQVMALSGGRAHPQRLVEILKLRLGA
jgi:aspartyl-tRNA(Asn)/glutamyl-tRNA(Gln) amidotransferase subunit B